MQPEVESGRHPLDERMKVYTAKHVAKLLDLSVEQVRSYARAGFLDPERGPRGEYRFSFQDLVLLRTAKGLLAERVPARKVRRALRKLKDQLPGGRPLTGVRICAEGDRIFVQDAGTVWNAETGQSRFNFEVASLVDKVRPLARRAARAALESDAEMTADDWYTLGTDLEHATPDHALEAYRRALDVDPDHFDTRVNLGRLLHECGRLHAAETHLRLALGIRSRDATALFNMAICLEELGRAQESLASYRQTIEADPKCADAYYNMARVYEALGDSAAAQRHLQVYRQLTDA
jgi:DNA-binding transcriptional MerR regulator